MVAVFEALGSVPGSDQMFLCFTNVCIGVWTFSVYNVYVFTKKV